MSSAAFTLPAFAKINLSLRVLGRRTDGYHELETIFQTITLQDRLTFATRDDERLTLTCDAPDIPVDESNLIIRAAGELRRLYEIKKGAQIHLEKRIPAAGGLGGGSSNAAITLLALAQLWQLKIEKHELEKIGTRLGADVPFFFTGGTARATGVGTELTALGDLPAKHLLIVTPNVKVSTAEAYQALNAPALTKARADIILFSSRPHEEFSDLSPDDLRNDFEPVIFKRHPEIKRVKASLLSAGARGALLSGSGASVFGLFDNTETQGSAAQTLSAVEGWRVFKCETLSRQQYLKALGTAARPLL